MFFIKNKYENMDMVSLDNAGALYDLIVQKLSKLGKNDYIAIYAKRYIISTLFTQMIKDGYSFGYADFDIMDDMLSDETYMMFVRGNCKLSVEPAYSSKNTIIGHDAKCAIISMEDCKQDIIDYCVNRGMDVILYDFDVEEDDSCGKCHTTEFDTDDKYHVTVKCALDADEVLASIREMESRMQHISEMFVELGSLWV